MPKPNWFEDHIARHPEQYADNVNEYDDGWYRHPADFRHKSHHFSKKYPKAPAMSDCGGFVLREGAYPHPGDDPNFCGRCRRSVEAQAKKDASRRCRCR
jgi:Ulp1 family protease